MHNNRPPDRLFIVLAAALLLLGLVMLMSASGPVAIQKFGDPYYFLKHQVLYGVLPGLALFFVATRVEFGAWRRAAPWFFGGAIALLLLVFVPGLGAEWGSSRSWLNIFGWSLQPAELAKPALIIYLAMRFEEMGQADTASSRGLLLFAVATGAVAGLLMAQPDLGSLTVIVGASVAVYFVAGASWKHLALMAVFAGASFAALVRGSQYRVNRLMTFLHPEKDPLGIGYHINQAFLAIGSGGLFGLGLGHSRQKFLYLPEVINDSIFAVMAEEIGFILTLAYLVMLFVFLWRGAAIAQGVSDRFGRMVVIGFVAWIFTQTIFNIGSMVGLVPITGLPLPFMSYGGTSMAILLGALGLVVNISRQSQVGGRQ